MPRTGRRSVALVLWTAGLLAGAIAFGDGAPEILVGPFSKAHAGGELPPGWRSLSFPRIDRETRYALVDDAGVVVVRADSDAGASGLIRSVSVDPARLPILRWRWKIEKVLAGSDVHRKQGDDYAARVYVAFAYDPARVGWLERMRYEALRWVYGEAPPYAAINYIWASDGPVGQIVPNPYSDRARMIVVESGDGRAGAWVEERRDVEADYRRAFGEAPAAISGVAIMTDTDDTGGSARSWYGDIALGPRTDPSGADGYRQ